MEYKNFFENKKEAQLRLQGTVVLYDGEPVEIMALADHVPDGIVRVYIRPIGLTDDEYARRPSPDIGMFPMEGNSLGEYLDTYIETNKSSGIVRKHINSPLFNKFRPFELGMYWADSTIVYVERQPSRRVEQGLTSASLLPKKLALVDEGGSTKIKFFGPEMRRCIVGEHPSPYRCIEALHDPKLANKAAAFHRHFALLKGPIDTLFLGYKSNVIGLLPNGDFSKVNLGKNYRYCKEVVEELHLFNTIN